MKKKKNSKIRLEIARKIISDVNREMQKPRLTASVRNDGRYKAAPLTMGGSHTLNSHTVKWGSDTSRVVRRP